MVGKNRISELRLKNNLTQKELSKEIDVNYSVLSRIESGDRPLKDDEVIKLANYFNVTTDYLLGRTNNPSPQNADPNIDDLIVLGRDMQSLTDDQKETIIDMIKIFNKKNGI